ncbi:OCR-like antirestriction protein [Bacillus phage vB_BcgM]|nr:OCR-like antirestriction protein [Bacillus phage vB_BcgM]
MTKQLTLADYDTLEALEGDIDVLESFYEYEGSTYVCDAIQEIADKFIPIYTHELWKNVRDIKEYIEEAMSQGLCETPRGEQPDLDKIFGAGYYQYYSQLLYDNEASLYYNYISVIVNKWLEGLNYDQIEKIDIDKLDERIEEERADIDNNSYMEDLEDIAKRVIAEFKCIVNKDASWENYGDVNALEHGGVFIKKDTDYPLDKCYYVVKVINMDSACGEEGYMVEECYMDLKDDWIDWEAVESTCDIAESDGVKVCDLLSYYGITEFNGETYEFDNESEVLEHLAEQGICIEE